MSVNREGRYFLACVIVLISILACDITTPAAQPTQTPIEVTATQAAATNPPVPGTAVSTSTGAASCTVLQDLNLRNGPGTAYAPPIDILKKGVEFTPIGFNPQGVPGGTWVQAKVTSINKTGWVSAGKDFVSCNIDLASLPKVDVQPPPKPAPPRIGTGAVDGNGISNFRFSFDYNPEYLLRMYVFRSDDDNEVFDTAKDGRGITSVKFTVTSADGGTTYYDSTENNPAYCIFGGDASCNPWVFEDSQYKWTQGGDAVVAGNYVLLIQVTATDDEVGVWQIQINIQLP